MQRRAVDPSIILKLSYIAYFMLNIMPLNLVLIKKNQQQLHSRSQYWNDNEAATANGGFVHKANIVSKATDLKLFITTAKSSNSYIYRRVYWYSCNITLYF